MQFEFYIYMGIFFPNSNTEMDITVVKQGLLYPYKRLKSVCEKEEEQKHIGFLLEMIFGCLVVKSSQHIS